MVHCLAFSSCVVVILSVIFQIAATIAPLLGPKCLTSITVQVYS